MRTVSYEAHRAVLASKILSLVGAFRLLKKSSERRNIFSKDIYERKPAEKVLEPLGLIKVIGGERFETFALQTNRPNVIRLVNLFKEGGKKGQKDKISEWAGVNLLRERRMKYSGLTERKESN